jgi:hypothetical protein
MFFSKSFKICLKIVFNQFDAVLEEIIFFEVCQKKIKRGDPYQKIKKKNFFP